MKSYWILATVVLVTVWPSSSKAYVAGLNQSQAEASPTQQTTNPSPVPQASAATQEPSTATQTAVANKADAKSSGIAVSQPSSYMLVELSRSLKAKKLKPGDKVKAEVSQDVISYGKVIIPVETELVGHVTEVRVQDGANSESRLGIVFDRILLKHYHDINFHAVVQAVAAPAIRRSRVDEPSQMLPPSMVGGSSRTTSMSPVSGGSFGGSSSHSQSSSSTSGPQSSADMSTVSQASLTVKESPSTNAASGTSAAQLTTGPGGKPLSIGTPQGVTGIKGLRLSLIPTADTPGPVIVSTAGNVKLESGTQILLRVVSIEAQK